MKAPNPVDGGTGAFDFHGTLDHAEHTAEQPGNQPADPLVAELEHGYVDLFKHPTAVDRLLAQGVRRNLIAWPNGLDHKPIGLARVRFDGYTFEPADDGVEAVLLPVRRDRMLIDVVAWPLNQPRKWRTRRGIATVLGGDAIRRAFHLNRAILIHEMPVQWLAAGRCGAVVLDVAAARFELATAPRLAVSNQAFGERLDRLLNQPPPRFSIEVVV